MPERKDPWADDADGAQSRQDQFAGTGGPQPAGDNAGSVQHPGHAATSFPVDGAPVPARRAPIQLPHGLTAEEMTRRAFLERPTRPRIPLNRITPKRVGYLVAGAGALLVTYFTGHLGDGWDYVFGNDEQAQEAPESGLEKAAQTAEPIIEGGQLTAPAFEGGEATVPAVEGGEATSPVTDAGEPTAPVAAEGGENPLAGTPIPAGIPSETNGTETASTLEGAIQLGDGNVEGGILLGQGTVEGVGNGIELDLSPQPATMPVPSKETPVDIVITPKTEGVESAVEIAEIPDVAETPAEASSYATELVDFARRNRTYRNVISRYVTALKKVLGNENKVFDEKIGKELERALNYAMKARPTEEGPVQTNMDQLIAEGFSYKQNFEISRRGFRGGWDVVVEQDGKKNKFSTDKSRSGILDDDYAWKNWQAEEKARESGQPWDGMTADDFIDAYIASANPQNPKDESIARGQGHTLLSILARGDVEGEIKAGHIDVPDNVAVEIMSRYAVESVRQIGEALKAGEAGIQLNAEKTQDLWLGPEKFYEAIVLGESTQKRMRDSVNFYEGLLAEAAKPAAK